MSYCVSEEKFILSMCFQESNNIQAPPAMGAVPATVGAPMVPVSMPGAATGIIVQGQPQMAYISTYPSPNPVAATVPAPPTEQPYAGHLTGLEFHQAPNMVYAQQQAIRQQTRRPPQQLYVPPSHRQQPM